MQSFKALRALRPAGKRVLKPYATLQVAGSVSDSHQERIQAQQEHFASLEAGVKCDMRAVLQPASDRPPEARFEDAEVPTLSAVEASIRAFRRGKAPGPDMIPDWVWSLQPVQAAHPPLLNLYSRGGLINGDTGGFSIYRVPPVRSC